MAVHKIKKGLNLPISGLPEQKIENARTPSHVACLAADFLGLKATMHVKPGDEVRRGQLLFEDKKMPGVRYTAMASGKVVAVNRGERRALQSVVIALDEDERRGKAGAIRFASDTGKHPAELTGAQVKELLVESGLWIALRARPFSKVADPGQQPRSIFVTATDTSPLAADPAVVMAGDEEAFERGLVAVSKLTDGKVYVCASRGSRLTLPEVARVQKEEFEGPHPAGTVGLHIHLLDPVDRHKLVWHLGYQDVIAIGKLFTNGELDVSRVIALAGPAVKRPRLLRARLGAATDPLVDGELEDGDLRVLSGSVLSGRRATGDVLGYLGRYHQQISVIREGREREFLGWLAPGLGKFSMVRAFAAGFLPQKKLGLTSTTNGSDRAMVPIGMYEKVFPMDILPSFLLRSILVGDVERAEQLGVLELDEEDLALCSFVCPGKHDYGSHLRDALTTIEKEG